MDAKEYGSIFNVEKRDYDGFLKAWELTAEQTVSNVVMLLWYNEWNQVVPILAKQAKILSQKYDVVVTNPPYMGISNGNVKLNEFVKKNYPDSKSDLFAVFIERCGQMIKENRYQAMITQHAWMFLSSFEKLRTKLQMIDTVNMAHLGARAFEEIGGEVVQTTSFVMRKSHIAEYKGTYCRLIEPKTQQGKEEMYLAGENRYTAVQDNFTKIPGSPVAYWVSSKAINDFCTFLPLSSVSEVTRGLTTGNNDLYLRMWYEVCFDDISVCSKSVEDSVKSGCKWFPHNKGGEFRTWYGNNDLVVMFYNAGETLKKYYKINKAVRFTGIDFYFYPGITWSALTTGKNSFRYSNMHIFDSNKGPMLFSEEDDMLYYILAFLNSCVTQYFINILNPSLSLQNADITNLPFVRCNENILEVNTLSEQNVEICRHDWDSFETSWDFQQHPLVALRSKSKERTNGGKWQYCVEDAFFWWTNECETRFTELKENEETLNRIFIDIYGLQNELTPEVDDKDVTVRKADLSRDIRSFISYAVGCMFGRYSLDQEGLMFAGGDMRDTYAYYGGTFADTANIPLDGKYTFGTMGTTFYYLPVDGKEPLECWKVDADNIIPITDEEYFTDDVVNRFAEFVKTVYGEETLEENLDFIAQALGNKGDSSREVIRNYFLKDFYTDHLKVYQKRPIYWLFDSGKLNGFKALIYMHRYNADTIGNLRVDYLHRMERIYESEINRMQDMIDNP